MVFTVFPAIGHVVALYFVSLHDECVATDTDLLGLEVHAMKAGRLIYEGKKAYL